MLRFIARGGMGEVYEVLDTTLNERVALKTLRGGVGDAEALERFKRELLLSRRVTHENVCRVYDLGSHRDPQRGDETLFLTMELLPGESLSDHVAHSGKLGIAEASALARQLVEALAAAHAQGVVHRDFKSPNVLLVPGKDGASRAVVTDFGLARAPAGDGPSATSTGALLGSPAYMAPEQAEGKVAGPAADVYALGVVLFEMVTGRLPFEGGSPMEVAVRRLHEPPPSPRSFVPDLDAGWEKAILRCLEKDPAERFPDVRAVAAALDDHCAVASRPAPAAAPRRRTRLALAAASLALLAALLLFRGMTGGAAPAPNGPIRLAALSLLSLGSGAERRVGRAVEEGLTSSLDASPGIVLVGHEDRARMAVDLGLPATERQSEQDARRIHDYSGADRLLSGRLWRDEGGGLKLEIALQDSATGTVVARQLNGSPKDPADLGARAAALVRELLGLPPDPGLAAAARASLPSGDEATAAFLEGEDQLWAGELGPARERLERAVEADPKHGPAWAALAIACKLAWDRDRGAAAAAKAVELGGYPKKYRWWFEALAKEFRGEWEPALAIMRGEFAARPDLRGGLSLAEGYMAAGRPSEVYPVLDRLRALPPPDGKDPRLDLVEHEAAINALDGERALAAARRAEASAQARGARVALADAQCGEADVLLQRGEFDRATELTEEARTTLLGLDLKRRLVAPMAILAAIAWGQGRGAEGRRLYGDLLQLLPASPGERASFRLNAAYLALDQGDLESASRLVNEARVEADPNRPDHAGIFKHVGGLLAFARGDLAAAREALESLPGDGSAGPTATANRARNLGHVQLAMGEVAKARENLERARDLFKSNLFSPEWACTRVFLAEVSIAEGHPVEGVTEAQGAARDLERFGMWPCLAAARTAEARGQLAQGKLEDARVAAQAAADLAPKHDFGRVKVEADTLLAWILVRAGQPKAAQAAARRASGQAALTGMPLPMLEARLATALVSGEPATRRKQAMAVALEAERTGYVLFARAAKEAAAPRP